MRARSLLLVPIVSVGIYACSSGGDSDPPLPAGPPPGYEDVLLEGIVTSEALQSFAQALAEGPPEPGGSFAAIIDWPGDGEALPSYPPASFCWLFGPLARSAPAAGGRWAGLAPQTSAPGAISTRSASPLWELLGPPRNAFAEGAPYSGPATYLVFSTATAPNLLRAFTSLGAFVPSQKAWDAMSKANEPITLTLVSASFEQNRVTPYGAVYEGTSITFTIAH